MASALLTLIGFQLLGDIVADIFSVPVPGMVIGLILLIAVLWARGRVHGPEKAVPEALHRVAKGLHDHLGLLFVPAGVGVMANLHTLATDAVGLFAAVVVSTVATVTVTGLTARWFRTEVPAVAPAQGLGGP
jgi:holin-like protein